MITRFALFEGRIAPGQIDPFRAAVLADLLPLWRSFPGILAVRVCFAEARDDGAPEFPLILAVDWPDMAAVEAFLAHPVRMQGRAATEALLARFFIGRIHHHVTTAHAVPPP